MSLEKKKTLTIKVVPDHIKKLQELKAQQELKTQMVEKEKEVTQDKKIPIYQKPIFKNAMEWLYKTFPNCFTQREQRPLKIDIFEDVVTYIQNMPEDQEKISKRGIRLALATYTRNRYYLKACIQGAKRINLSGEDVEEVTENEAEYALGMFKKYNTVYKEKKKREKQENKKPFKKDFNKDINKAPRTDKNQVRNFTYS